MCTEITFLAFSTQGQIAFTASSVTSHSVHVFSVNGESLGSKYVAGRVTGLVTVGDCLVVVDDAGDLTMSRLLGYVPPLLPNCLFYCTIKFYKVFQKLLLYLNIFAAAKSPQYVLDMQQSSSSPFSLS
ncbi:Neurobeachin-like protein 1 [Homalodisca vitripennis]|nr:Neurobeachin-like protein 1 [Homalodisca vitripennis]